MEKALEDTTKGIIKSLTIDTHAAGLATSIKAIDTKITNAGQNKATITKDEYYAIGKAVEKITKTIDDTLEVGGLTQLDTANLKTLRTAVENVGKTFASIGEMKLDAGTNSYKVVKDDFEKVSRALGKISEVSKEVGASATKALESSKAQAENIGEI